MKIMLIINEHFQRTKIKYALSLIKANLEIIDAKSYCDLSHNKSLEADIDIVILDCSNKKNLDIFSDISNIKKIYIKASIVCMLGSSYEIKSIECYKNGANGCFYKDHYIDYLHSIIRYKAHKHFFIPEHFLNFKNTALNTARINLNSHKSTHKHGEQTLTSRQEEIMDFIKYGKSNKEISNLLGISEGTTRTHVSHIFNRLNVCNRTEAVHVATKLGYL